jgi:hypothetical protein
LVEYYQANEWLPNTCWIYIYSFMDNIYEWYQFTCATVAVLIILLIVFRSSDFILITALMFLIHFNFSLV